MKSYKTVKARFELSDCSLRARCIVYTRKKRALVRELNFATCYNEAGASISHESIGSNTSRKRHLTSPTECTELKAVARFHLTELKARRT